MIAVMLDSLLAADAGLRAWLATHHAPWLDGILWTLSALGVGGSIWIAIAAVMASWVPRLRAPAWQVVLAVILAQGVVDWGIKPMVGRPRPFIADATSRVVGYQPSTYSFPSGHSASSFAAATVLAFALTRRRAAITWALAVAVASSRIYIGVHYPLDVVVGALVGVLLGVLVTGGRAWYIRGSSEASHLVPR
jgi:undecaprenyl-diphosphatase